MNYKLVLVAICLLINLARSEEEEYRVLELKVNPNCNNTIKECNQFDETKSDLSIAYIKSIKFKKNNEKKDGRILHFILSTFGGSPAFFVVSTKNDTDIEIDYKNLLKGDFDSIQFLDKQTKKEDVFNTIGVLISRLFLWLDNSKDANADYKPDVVKFQKTIDLNDFIWKNVTILTDTKDNVHLNFEMKEKVLNGTINLRFMMTSATQKYIEKPSLVLTPRSVHSQLTVVGFTEVWPLNETARLGMQLTVVSKGVKQPEEPTSSFDDEYSPGTRLI